MSQHEAVRRLLQLPKFGSGVGLHRMRWLFDQLPDSPQPAIKITGSNGKGSVVAMTDAILRALGIRTGRYTSPHLRRFNERIAVDGWDISDSDLLAGVRWFEAAAARYAAQFPEDRIGAFEAFTATAMWHFGVSRAEVLVLEAGIGGRYDSIRPLPGGVTALVSVDLEHTEVLGNTLELIALDKADLCPPGGVLVVGRLESELLRRLAGYAAIREFELRPITEACEVSSVRRDAAGASFSLSVGNLRIPQVRIALAGRHQVDNACVATMLVLAWIERSGSVFDADAVVGAVVDGLAAARWPGRCEQVGSDPDVYIDVGHSPAAAASFCQTIRDIAGERPVILVFGVSRNKDVQGVAEALVPVAAEVICTRAHHKGAEVSEIERTVRACAPSLPTFSGATVEAAMAAALERARALDGVVAVGGGLFLAVEAEAVLRGEDPTELVFL